MPEEFYESDFPNIRNEGWQRTSEPANYNCIAFAAGDLSRYWWPNLFYPDPSDDYWPEGVPHTESVDAFLQAFETVGFVVCNDDLPEVGFEKIAIYATDTSVRHAAILQENGKWRSKLGPHEDIETTLVGLEGPCYGKVVAYLKRPRPTQ